MLPALSWVGPQTGFRTYVRIVYSSWGIQHMQGDGVRHDFAH